MARDILLGDASAVFYRDGGSRTALVDFLLLQEATAGVGYSLTADAGAIALSGGEINAVSGSLPQLTISGEPTPIIATAPNNVVVLFGNVSAGPASEVAPGLSLYGERLSALLTGRPATMEYSGAFEATAGAFDLRGHSIGFGAGRRVSAAVGEFVYSLATTLKSMDAFRGVYSLTGQEASLSYGATTAKLIAQGAAFDLLGVAAGLDVRRPIKADGGGFSLAAIDVAIAIGHRAISVNQGEFALAGGATGNNMSARPAAFVLVGRDVAMELNADTFWHRVEDTPEIWTKVSL